MVPTVEGGGVVVLQVVEVVETVEGVLVATVEGMVVEVVEDERRLKGL